MLAVASPRPAHLVRVARPGEERAAIALGVAVVLIAGIATAGVFLVLLVGLTVASIIQVRLATKRILRDASLVTPTEHPRVYALVEVARARLGLSQHVDALVVHGVHLNAYAIGTGGRYCIVVESAAVEHLKSDELLFVIGHELTHVALGHTEIATVVGYLPDVHKGTNPAGALMGVLFNVWRVKAEYAADRGGLIVCRNVAIVERVMYKLAGGKLNTDVLATCPESDVGNDLLDYMNNHPSFANRVAKIRQFGRQLESIRG